MLTVLSWFWAQPGGKTAYTALHANIWADSVRRNLSLPHRIACVTDTPEGIDPSVEIIHPPREFEHVRIPTWGEHRPQCLRRIAMFAPDAGNLFGERFVCMDLDCVITGPLDPLFDVADDFRMFRGTGGGRPYNGSMMLLKSGARPRVYEEFTPQNAAAAGHHFKGSDQAWISHCLGAGEATWGTEHGVGWYGDRRREDTRLLFFPGSTKPWDKFGLDPLVTEHYRRTPSGSQSVYLGRGSKVWSEAERAFDQGPVSAVFAYPETAKHWPGPVELATWDRGRVSRLSRMMGLGEPVACGAFA